MPGIKLAQVKSKGDGYKRYQTELKNWINARTKARQANEAAKQNKKK